MKFKADGPPAIPLWINGHAYLTVSEHFADVCDAESSEVLRRVPLCGAGEALAAVAATESALPVWAGLSMGERQGYLQALATELDQYASHFASLLQQECGGDAASANAEVVAAVAVLTAGRVGQGGTAALALSATRPLATVAEALAPVLLAGGTAVCKPDPKAPSVVLALCELSARAGWPAGVLNLVHGDSDMLRALAATEIERLIGGSAVDLEIWQTIRSQP